MQPSVSIFDRHDPRNASHIVAAAPAAPTAGGTALGTAGAAGGVSASFFAGGSYWELGCSTVPSGPTLYSSRAVPRVMPMVGPSFFFGRILTTGVSGFFSAGFGSTVPIASE